jgi:hypothetical protein
VEGRYYSRFSIYLSQRPIFVGPYKGSIGSIMQKSTIVRNISQLLWASRTPAPVERAHITEAYRRFIRIKWQEYLRQKCQRMLLEGKYPFETGWRTEQEIVVLKAALLKRDRATIFDLALIFGAVITLDILLCVIIFFVLDAA